MIVDFIIYDRRLYNLRSFTLPPNQIRTFTVLKLFAAIYFLVLYWHVLKILFIEYIQLMNLSPSTPYKLTVMAESKIGTLGLPTVRYPRTKAFLVTTFLFFDGSWIPVWSLFNYNWSRSAVIVCCCVKNTWGGFSIKAFEFSPSLWAVLNFYNRNSVYIVSLRTSLTQF